MADEKYNAKIKAFAGDRAEWPVFKGKFKSLLVLKGLYDALYESGPEKPFKELLEAEGIVEKEEPDDGDDDDEEEAMLRVLEATGKFKTPGKKEVEDEGEAKQEEAKEVAEQLAKALKTREQQRTAKKEAKEAARRDEDKWRTQNYLIYAHLATNTEGAAYDVVREFEEVMDGSAAYRALVVKYECSGMAQKTDLHSKLVNDTIKGGEDPDRYFRRIEEVQRQLRDVGVPIKNQSMLGFALAKLPPVYSTLGLILEADPKLTYDNFKSRIRSYYERKVSVEDERLSAHVEHHDRVESVGVWLDDRTRQIGGQVLNVDHHVLREAADAALHVDRRVTVGVGVCPDLLDGLLLAACE
jgi:hypothetical protein